MWRKDQLVNQDRYLPPRQYGANQGLRTIATAEIKYGESDDESEEAKSGILCARKGCKQHYPPPHCLVTVYARTLSIPPASRKSSKLAMHARIVYKRGTPP